MRVGEGFICNGLIFNNEMAHITISKIELGLDKMFENENEQISFNEYKTMMVLLPREKLLKSKQEVL